MVSEVCRAGVTGLGALSASEGTRFKSKLSRFGLWRRAIEKLSNLFFVDQFGLIECGAEGVD